MSRAKAPRAPRPVRTPTLLQTDPLECGAISLAIVLAHHGRWVLREELVRECHVTRDGSRAASLLRAARGHGMEAQGFRAEPGALAGLRPPLILHWNFNHYLVLDGFVGRGRARLNDPATGPRLVSVEELERSMTGVVLALTPGPDFRRGGRPPRVLDALLRRARQEREGLPFLFLVGLAAIALGLMLPAFQRVFVDRLLGEGEWSWLRPLLGGMAALGACALLLTWLEGDTLTRLETRATTRGSRAFLSHVLRLPVQFFDLRYKGDISGRVALNARVTQFLFRDLALNALGAVLVVFYALLMAQYSVPLTVASVAVVVLNVAALRWVARMRRDGSLRLRQEESKQAGTAQMGLRMIETLKATGSESELFSMWAGYQARVANLRQELARSTYWLDLLPPLLAGLNGILVLAVGGIQVMNGELTLGALLAFQILMAAFMAPAQRLVSLGSRLQTAQGDVNRLDDVLAQLPALPAEEGRPAALRAPVPDQLTGRLELRGVTFGFDRLSPPLVRGLDLELRPGTRVALVGRTGSGKSTISRLVAGLYDPWGGDILLDGRPRGEFPRELLVCSVGVVDQNVFVFEGTVRDNLTLWDPGLPMDRVVQAARDACIHDDIMARGGYDARVEEGGSNWSGGQLQRLDIARSLARDPVLLVLDEATAALDALTEARIVRNVRRRGCACLIVAHRLSTIRDADEILVLESGEVVERGPADELARRAGAFAQLVAAE